MDENECRRNPGTCIQITALDAIVNVNSLFTIAVFIGLALNPTDGTSNLVQDPSCIAGQKIAEDFVAFHVFSFSSFLFSSLVAKGIKQVIKSADSTAYTTPTAYVNKSVLRGGMLVSAVGSVCGSGFLMLALVNMLQIKLGTLACGSSATISAVVPLVILVPTALLIYVSSVVYAFTR